MDATHTRERLLDTAERLFAAKGIRETSLRDITAAAQTNLAAVNYHFGSKEGLLRAVLARRIDPLNQERLRLLDGYEAQAGDAPVPLEKILHAFTAPSITLCYQSPDYMRLVGRILLDPDAALREMFLSQFKVVAHRFLAALSRALPTLPEAEIVWRVSFVIGAEIHTWIHSRNLEFFSADALTFADEQDVLERLIAFSVAGMRAPLPRRLKERYESTNGQSRHRHRTNPRKESRK
ncbi:MAG: TetR family transcriptional regulator [Abditibacteriales bacterium]|nr:TetR family transcriptional regulator [Abditibacteriales bacterium]MDW8366812.1 TetR family transcriptional regulator [Abditibacteriales bacterium]